MDEQSLMAAILVALLATPWLVAAALLWRGRRRRAAIDGPARLLTVAVAMLPEERRDWGAAMTAELAQLDDRAPRWRFALGCVRVAVLAPRGSRMPGLVTAALAVAAVATAALAVGHALPALRVFAVTFVALLGVAATLAAARGRRPSAAAPIVTTAALTGVAASIAVTACVLAEHPGAAAAFQPGYAAFLAVVMAGCVWLALTPPAVLTTSGVACHAGAAAALTLAAGFLLVSRLAEGGGVLNYLLLAPMIVLMAGSAAAAEASGSFRAGVKAAIWATVLGTLLIFAIGLPEAVHWYESGGALHIDGDEPGSIGQNLVDYVVLLALFPAWGCPSASWARRSAVPGNRATSLPGAKAARRRASGPRAHTRRLGHAPASTRAHSDRAAPQNRLSGGYWKLQVHHRVRVPVDDLPGALLEAEDHRGPQYLRLPLGVPGVQDVGALDRNRVRQLAPHVLDQVLEVDLGAARAECARREQVALVDRRDAGLTQAAEPAEDRRRVPLGGDRQPR